MGFGWKGLGEVVVGLMGCDHAKGESVFIEVIRLHTSSSTTDTIKNNTNSYDAQDFFP